MVKKHNIYGKKKNTFMAAVIGMTIVTALTTGLLSISMILMNINIYRSEQIVKQASSSVMSLEGELKNIKEQENEYKNQAEVLQQQLSQYEPVVIPDSMK